MNELVFKRTEPGDAQLFYNWRMEETARAMSVSGEEITWEEHLAWFTAKLKDENSELRILMSGDDQVGQVRLDKREEGLVISYSIDKDFRGRGFGKKLVAMIIEEFAGIAIIAYVKKDNPPSIKIFQNLGFDKDGNYHSEVLIRYVYTNQKK